jgi:hypothetical protein
MQSKHHHTRPIVLRELSMLRALGASLRTFRRPGRGALRAFGFLPKADSVAMLAHPGVAPLRPEKKS